LDDVMNGWWDRAECEAGDQACEVCTARHFKARAEEQLEDEEETKEIRAEGPWEVEGEIHKTEAENKAADEIEMGFERQRRQSRHDS